MQGQMTIFDLLKPPDNDIESMDTEEIAKIISNATGLEFKQSGWLDEYEAKPKKNIKLTVHKSRYHCDVGDNKEGDAFISCSWQSGTSGTCGPRDSIEEAIKFFRQYMTRVG